MKRYKATYECYGGGELEDLIIANSDEEAKEIAKKKDSIISRLIEVKEW